MTYRLRVNPITCDAHGVCAELLPEFIRLDPGGTRSCRVPICPRISSSTRGWPRRPARRWRF